MLLNVDTSSVSCFVLMLQHIFNDTNLGKMCLRPMLDTSVLDGSMLDTSVLDMSVLDRSVLDTSVYHCLMTKYCTSCQFTSISSL